MRGKLFLMMSLMTLLTFGLTAQSMSVKGKITDDAGEPVFGANIVVKGTNQGTVSNDQGEYAISVEKGATLIFSYIGFGNKEIVVGNSTVIDVSLNPDLLEEIVVTALGIKREKKALGYSVSEVKGDELTQARTVNIANSLQGKVAGLNISSIA